MRARVRKTSLDELFEEWSKQPPADKPSAKDDEEFDKSAVETIGWVDLPRGGFKRMLPRLRVEIYARESRVYGPIMVSFNAVCPENMKLSQTLAQAHLPTAKAKELIALLMVAIKKADRLRGKFTTFREIWLEAEQIALRMLKA